MRHLHDRRSFIRCGWLAVSGAILGASTLARDAGDSKKLFSAIGMSGSLDRAAALKAHGVQFLTVSTNALLAPDRPEDVFQRNLGKLKESPLPVIACNSFIRPKHLRCVGVEANHDQVLEWSEIALHRLKQAGGKFMVFGSAGARALRDDWPKDKADVQFVSLLKRMGPIAEKHGIIVVVEQLRAKECNYINRIGEAAALIREVDHPNIRLLADLYHMAQMGDTSADLKAAMDVVVHVEIAEKAERTYPGVAGDDFRPYFRVLRDAGYHGAISIEGKGSEDQVAAAIKEIEKQAAEV